MGELASKTVEFDRLPPRRARWFVRSTLTDWDLSDLIGDAELLVDELVSNAMLHARGRGVDVTIRAHGTTVRVEVSDPDPQFALDERDPGKEPGRFGLRIVDSIAPRWGVEPTDFGKVAWFELDRAS
jgi:D-alanyl-D-alanine dipeptidase